MRYHEGGCRSGLAAGLPGDGAQRLAMEVIEVSVRYQDDIHWRQVAQVQSRLSQALEDEEPARKVRIDYDILSANLQEEAGVSDEGDAEFAV